MDQLKEQLAVVMKHGFWIGSAVVLLGSLGVWFLTTGALVDETNKETGKIKSDDSSITSVSGDMSTQPNEFSHKRMDAMIEDRKKQVLEAWQKVFDAQKDILTWPELTEDFIDRFRYVRDEETGEIDRNRLKLPVEQYVEFPPQPEETVPGTILNYYARYIGKVLPDIAKMGKTEWTAEFDGESSGGGFGGLGGFGEMGGMGMGMGMGGGRGASNTPTVSISGVAEGPVVAWSRASQEGLLADLFPWQGKDPTTLQVYYSQENLWILRQLMQIIADVNGDAKQPFEAKIHEIKKIGIGKSVQFGQGKVSKPGQPGGMGGMGGGDMDSMLSGMGGGTMEAGMGMGDTGAGAAVVEVDPADNRYVNTALEQITGSDLRGAFGSKSPDQVALAVVKRVPVMMRLKMDQRDVDDLLAACANAPLMVDVRQVRELPEGSSPSAGGGSGMDGMMGGMEEPMDSGDMGMGGGMGGGMGLGGGRGGGGGGGGQPKETKEFPADMDIEIYGLIHFYNPPDEEALGIEKVTDTVELDSTVGETGNSSDAPAPTETNPAPATGNNTPPPADPDAGGNENTPPADPDAANPAVPAVAPGANNTPAAVATPAAGN